LQAEICDLSHTTMASPGRAVTVVKVKKFAQPTASTIYPAVGRHEETSQDGQRGEEKIHKRTCWTRLCRRPKKRRARKSPA